MTENLIRGLLCSLAILSVPARSSNEAWAQALDAQAPSKTLAFTDANVTDAIQRGYEVIRTGVKNYPTHRECFSCHHQALPLVAFSLNGRKSPEEEPTVFVQSELTQAIVKFTEDSFKPKTAMMRDGGGVGGRALTAAYGLWTFDVGGAPRSDTTDAMVQYLLKTQADDGAWDYQSHRPPAASSRVMTTAIAVYGLRAYGVEWAASIENEQRVQKSLLKAHRFAEQHTLDGTHEELIGALWLDQMLLDEWVADGLKTKQRIDARIDELWQRQNSDGGWSQTHAMSSDAYATGQALLMLAQLDSTEAIHSRSSFLQGVSFLLNSQQPDGSWHVATRSKPVQVYFDNDDPHGKDQFISMMATSWSTAALANFLIAGKSPLESFRVMTRKLAIR